MPRALTDEQKKLLILAIVGLVFTLGVDSGLEFKPSCPLSMDIYLRWYAIGKRFSEGCNLYDSRNGQEVTAEVWGEHGLPWPVNFSPALP